MKGPKNQIILNSAAIFSWSKIVKCFTIKQNTKNVNRVPMVLRTGTILRSW